MLIETDRIFLRKFELNDAQKMWELNSDPEVMRYTGDPPFESVDTALEFLKSYQEYEKSGFGRWAVINKKENNFVGWCGLKQHDRYVDIGFRFFKAEWGKGYASESALACTHYAFNALNLEELVGRVASENKASVRVLEKLHMQFWKSDTCKGIDGALYYKVTRNEFLQNHKV